MWRRFGDVAFGVLIGAAITLEVVPLAVLTWSFVRRAAGEIPASTPQATLAGAVASSALALILLTGYVLGYQLVSDRRERRAAERREAWVGRWIRVVFAGEPPPRGPLSRAAVEAVLEVREVLRGQEADEVTHLVRRYGVAGEIGRRLKAGAVSARLEALEALAKARLPEFLPAVIGLMGDAEPALRVAAARTAARILAATPSGADREEGAGTFAEALQRHHLPAGIVEEVLLLVDDTAPSVVLHLMHGRGATEASIRAGLEVVGRLKLVGFIEEVAGFVDHPEAEVRAAALRALSRLGFVPPEVEQIVLAGMADPVDFVRVNACRTARLLWTRPALPALWERLTDPSWWVRRAAAESLAAMGPEGLAELRRAMREHPDRYGRDMAAQILRDAGLGEGR